MSKVCKVKLLDGSFTSQVSRHTIKDVDGHPLWSSVYLTTEPEACVETHRDFIRGKMISYFFLPRIFLTT